LARMPQRLILVRHGEAGPPRAGRREEPGGASLSALGRRQAARLANVLTRFGKFACFSSPLARAAQTAEIALAPLGLSFDVDPRLREVDLGHWEGLPFEQIAARNPGGVEGWIRFDRNFTFPGGERLGDFLDRTQAAASQMHLLRADAIVLFTHGGVIRMLLCHLLGLDPRNYLLFDVGLASVTLVELYGERGVLVGLNDACHLADC